VRLEGLLADGLVRQRQPELASLQGHALVGVLRSGCRFKKSVTDGINEQKLFRVKIFLVPFNTKTFVHNFVNRKLN
jgi:hypothetical protein